MAAKDKNADTEIEPQKRLGDFPADESDPENPPKDAVTKSAEKLARQMDASLEVETADEDDDDPINENGLPRVTVMGTPVNPSSTYPGRNQELIENDMRIPTPLDLAKRAKFAGSQIPAEVWAAGLVDEDGNITVGEEAQDRDAEDIDESDDENNNN